MPLVCLSYDEAHHGGVALVGGKAWNLARAARWGFATPAGVAVSVADYRSVLADPRVAKLVGAVGEMGAADLSEPTAQAQLQLLREQIMAVAFPEADRAALRGALGAAGLIDARLAVRSSATGEDGTEQAFAGIHDSVLDVRGLDEVLAAIRHCQASLWTPQALAYRRRFAVADAAVQCGVLICAMVLGDGGAPPPAAGVAFTADPGNGDREMILIEAVGGLADQMVRGAVTPSRYRFRASIDGLCAEGAAHGPLPAPAALQLAKLAWRIHWAFGDGDQPQDIEWVFDGHRLVIVQVRPITALPHRSFAGLGSQRVIWSNGNIKEVYPGVLTPMAWSYLQGNVRLILTDLARDVGFPIPTGMAWARRFAGRTYLDFSAVQWLFFDAFGVTPADTNRTIGGAQPQITVSADEPYGGPAGRRRAMRNLRVGPLALALSRRAPAIMQRRGALARALRRSDLSQASAAALLRGWASLTGSTARLSVGTLNVVGDVWKTTAGVLAGWILDPKEVEPVLAGLMSGVGQAHSADHAYGLQRLMRQTPPGTPGFHAAWAAYLDAYGHRGFDELEIANPRWSEAPESLLALGAQLATAPHDRRSATRTRQHADQMLQGRPWLARVALRWLAKRAARGYALREDGKSHFVDLMASARAILLEIGRRLALAGHLDDPNDVFFLYVPEALAFPEQAWDGHGARQAVADRKIQRRLWASEAAPDVFIEDGHGAKAVRHATEATVSTAGAWRGIAASPGWARGPARLIHRPHEGGKLARGGILVASTSDPAWTPLFLLADALVVETGGYLSHGAIVAREFGIPAIVNVPGVMAAIPDGSGLAVDGNAGMVSLIADTPSEAEATARHG